MRDPESTHYHHTQVGWVVLGVVAAIAVVAVLGMPEAGTGLPGGPLLFVLALVALLFGTLTVEVDREAIRLRFGIGLIRKRIVLTEVRGWQAVRNPWYSGWGIRLLPGRAVLWNVSGHDAVELALADGRRFRVGTDEPHALVSAIAAARGAAGEVSPPLESLPVTPPGMAGWWPALLVGVVVLTAVGGLFWYQMQPPTVTVGPDTLEIGSRFYGRSFAAADIASISLEPTLPRVLVRTNGFAAAGILRGHFAVEGLGNGLLFVDLGTAPFVLVRLREGFVIVNLPEPEGTRALYDEMVRAWPDRAAFDRSWLGGLPPADSPSRDAGAFGGYSRVPWGERRATLPSGPQPVLVPREVIYFSHGDRSPASAPGDHRARATDEPGRAAFRGARPGTCRRFDLRTSPRTGCRRSSVPARAGRTGRAQGFPGHGGDAGVSLLAEVVSALREERIDHALIGAGAMALHGVSRATVDIDLLTVDTRALHASLWTGFEARDISVRVLKGDSEDPLAGSVRLVAGGSDIVDVVVGRYGWQAEILAASPVLSVGEVEIPVVDPAGLVLLKLHAGGPRDAWDITSLAETHEQWSTIRDDVDRLVNRLPPESQRLWKRLRAEV